MQINLNKTRNDYNQKRGQQQQPISRAELSLGWHFFVRFRLRAFISYIFIMRFYTQVFTLSLYI